MLDLITHEIPCPDDRAVRKFLWYSAFHDADLLSLRYDDEKRSDITLCIAHNVFNDIRQGVYLLRFQGVKHLEYACDEPHGHDRLYATIFLDSALLHRELEECTKPLYHLRILTWSGYIDLIFERFSIRLEGGRVDYRPLAIDDAINQAYRDRCFRGEHAELSARLQSDRPYDDMDWDEYRALGLYDDDLDEYHALGLYIVSQDGTPEETAARAREVLAMKLARHHARSFAAYQLGRFGTADDLPALTQLLLSLPPWHCKKRRTVLDAMEKIHERSI